MKVARLENWNIHFGRHGVRLTGQVYGHPDFRDGTKLSTQVERHQLNTQNRTITTRTVIYNLDWCSEVRHA